MRMCKTRQLTVSGEFQLHRIELEYSSIRTQELSNQDKIKNLSKRKKKVLHIINKNLRYKIMIIWNLISELFFKT